MSYQDNISDHDDQEALVPRQRALMGLRFSDEQDHAQVRKVGWACVGLVVLSVFLFIAHVHHKGSGTDAFGHLLIALVLPAIGYLGVYQDSPLAIWGFHIGNIQFAVFHSVTAYMMFMLIRDLEARSPEETCHALLPVEGLSRDPSLHDLFESCLAAVAEKQGHAPWLLFWWAMTSAPLWSLQLYSAYHAHEYYFRLRIRKLVARTNNEGHATVTELELEQAEAVE